MKMSVKSTVKFWRPLTWTKNIFSKFYGKLEVILVYFSISFEKNTSYTEISIQKLWLWIMSITKKHHKTTFIGQNFSLEKNYLPSNERESQCARFWRIVNRAIKMIKGCHLPLLSPNHQWFTTSVDSWLSLFLGFIMLSEF